MKCKETTGFINLKQQSREKGELQFKKNCKDIKLIWGSKFSSYEIELRNRVTQNDVTLRVTDSEAFVEILLSSY